MARSLLTYLKDELPALMTDLNIVGPHTTEVHNVLTSPPAEATPETLATVIQVDDSLIDPRLRAMSANPSSVNIEPESDLKQPRIRISEQNPLYGYVEGCSRGSQPYKLLRPRRLRTSIANISDARKRYYRVMNEIIAKCECLGRETGCYILLNAQRLNASGAPLTFASGRLRGEAFDKMIELSTEFSRAVSALLTAKSSTLTEMALEINNLKREREEAEHRARVAQEELSKIRGRGKEGKLLGTLLGNLEEFTQMSVDECSGDEE
ncbi:hypothetical protein BDN72DRAFT_863855 [Pluteus cervinus]|uniref:Uncharacterized protein n=1 Tax=Pluteus cervinus TaxID=181527 RepID=A0ACD3A5Z7_9AGAR|nr:hypothetical protein BDN72DRAFT_863855 [Pluteus cervinus]